MAAREIRTTELGEGILTEAGDEERLQYHVMPQCPKSTLCNHLACPSVGHSLCPHAELHKLRFQCFVLFCLIIDDAVYDARASGLMG